MENKIYKSIKPDESILKQMRECNLNRLMDDAQFDKIVQTCKVLQLPENTTLFEQNTQLTDIYLVISGGIKLLRLVSSGDEKVLDIVQPGKTFAEGALFSGNSEYPVTAMSVSPSIVVGFNGKRYLEILKSSNELCLNMLGRLSMRLKWMVNEVGRLTLHNARFRLIDYLLSQTTDDKSSRICISLSIPKHVLASRLSIKPETLSRTFKELSDRGLIHRDGTHIELINIKKLRQIVSIET